MRSFSCPHSVLQNMLWLASKLSWTKLGHQPNPIPSFSEDDGEDYTDLKDHDKEVNILKHTIQQFFPMSDKVI